MCPAPAGEPTNGKVEILHGGHVYDDQPGEIMELEAGELGKMSFNWTTKVVLSSMIIHKANLTVHDHQTDFVAFLIFSNDASTSNVRVQSEASALENE